MSVAFFGGVLFPPIKILETCRELLIFTITGELNNNNNNNKRRKKKKKEKKEEKKSTKNNNYFCVLYES